MSYVHQEYPKMIYHKSEPAKIVHSKEEHDEHKGWKESPAHFEVKEEAELPSEASADDEIPKEPKEPKAPKEAKVPKAKKEKAPKE